ncbi:MAG: DUF6602 domain-containing protein [Nitrospirota bacterium]
MIQHHFEAIEKAIIQLAKIQDIAGHSIHKGTPRELFIRNFLEKHLGKTVSFGTGEIIDADSKPRKSRNQHDIVIYRNEFPKLDFQGGISAFLAESVLATIEVKSNLDYKEFKKSFKSALKCKKLKRNYFSGPTFWYFPPKILNYIVTYDGPAKMKTIYDWIKKIEGELQFSYPTLPPTQEERRNIPSPGLDGVFVMGKGFIHFDNFMIDGIDPKIRKENQWMRWAFVDAKIGSLLMLFLNLAQQICIPQQKSIQLIPYMKRINGKLQWGN